MKRTQGSYCNRCQASGLATDHVDVAAVETSVAT